MQRTLASVLVSLSVVWAMGQTVFIPDLQFRDALNAWAPGLVDVDGNMQVDNAALTPISLSLTIDWSPCDLTGLGQLAGVYTVELSFPADGSLDPQLELSPAVVVLELANYPAATPWPVLPAELYELRLREMERADLPITGAALRVLHLRSMPNITAIPSMDLVENLFLDSTGVQSIDLTSSSWFRIVQLSRNAALTSFSIAGGDVSAELSISDCPLLTSIQIIGQCGRLYVAGVPALTSIGQLDDGMSFLYVGDVMNMTTLPVLPSTLQVLTISGTSISVVPDLPEGMTELYVINSPVSVLPTLPSTLEFLNILSCTSLTAVPALPEGLQNLYLGTLPLVAFIPTLPQSLLSLDIDDVPVSTLPTFPPNLYSITLANLPLSFLNVLPGSLQILNVSDCPIEELPDIPAGVVGIELDALPLKCLPHLPTDLSYLVATNTYVNCLPNIPLGIETSLPLCSVVNSRCKEGRPYAKGVLYLDGDEDGVFGNGEIGLPFGTITASPSGAMCGTDSAGRYALTAPYGQQNLRAAADLEPIPPTLPASRSMLFQVGSPGSTGLDFGVQLPAFGPDLRVISSWSLLRPGATVLQTMVMRNAAATEYGVEVRITVDPNTIYQSSTPPAAVQGNELVWTLDSMPTGSEIRFYNTYMIPMSATAGTLIQADAVIRPVEGDIQPANNLHTSIRPVVGSYDPNDKQVFPSTLTPEEAQTGRRVEYLIRFQNTGTSYAERVLITDTLSADLDHGSFRFLGSSHSSTWFYRDGALHFLFDPIYLPDSAEDQLGSNGFVLFSIETLPGLGTEAQISNEANIYFDFNEPVITDPCFLSVAVPDAITEMGQGSARVYPIPSNGIVNVQHNGSWINARASVVDALGAVVKEGRVEGTTTAFDLRSLPRGLYVLRLQKEGRNWSERIVLD